MIHVYALTDAAGPSLDLLGIADLPLELRSAGAAAAVLSRHAAAPEPTAEALLRHAAVVEAVHAHRAALPARFGAGVPDDRAVDDLLTDPGLAARLDRVRDRVEVDVRLVRAETVASDAGPAAGVPEGRTGRDHLRALAARAAVSASSERARQTAVDAVRVRLESLAVAVADRPPGSPRVLRHAALLVDRAALASFGQAAAAIAADLAPVHTVLCTGPWPPYNFVDATHAPASEATR